MQPITSCLSAVQSMEFSIHETNIICLPLCRIFIIFAVPLVLYIFYGIFLPICVQCRIIILVVAPLSSSFYIFTRIMLKLIFIVLYILVCIKIAPLRLRIANSQLLCHHHIHLWKMIYNIYDDDVAHMITY